MRSRRILDVEWAGAVAPGAKIDLVVSPTTNTAFGGDTVANYIINNNLAGILGYSYGLANSMLGTAGNALYQANVEPGRRARNHGCRVDGR